MHQTRTEYNVRVEVAKLFPNSNFANNNRLYNSSFNLTHKQIVWLYLRIIYIHGDDMDRYWKLKHMLWTLYYLKTYPTFDSLSKDVGCHRDTLSKWIYYTADLLSDLDMVSVINSIKNTLTP